MSVSRLIASCILMLGAWCASSALAGTTQLDEGKWRAEIKATTLGETFTEISEDCLSANMADISYVDFANSMASDIGCSATNVIETTDGVRFDLTCSGGQFAGGQFSLKRESPTAFAMIGEVDLDIGLDVPIPTSMTIASKRVGSCS